MVAEIVPDPAAVEAADECILVIKLGALGDVIVSFGPLAAIRRHHPHAAITVLTTPPFGDLYRRSGHVAEVWTDGRLRLWRVGAVLDLRARLRSARFSRVYDLQTNDRTALYYRLMGPGRRPEWSGTARGCSHPHTNPRRRGMHALDRMAEQLAIAGVHGVTRPDLDWMDATLDDLALPERFVLLVTGSSPGRPEKRWPHSRFARLANRLADRGLASVLVGTRAEADANREIAAASASVVDLTGRTSLDQLAALARRAEGAVGNDTGPMHLAALVGCPSLVLFSASSDPARHAPVGHDVGLIQQAQLSDLSVDRVFSALRLR